MIELLAGLPVWGVYAVVGAIMGGLGALVATPFRNKYPAAIRILPIVAIVATRPIVQNFIEPRLFEARVNQSVNKDLPKKIDDVTTLTHVTFKDRRFIYDYAISDTVSAFDVNAIKSLQLSGMCKHWKPQFDRGETVSAEYRYVFKDNTGSFTVNRSDCP